MKYCFIDTETTGTDPQIHGVIQLAGWLVIDGKIVENFNFKCRPFEQDEVVTEALVVNKTTIEELEAYPDPREIYQQFTRLLGRYVDKYDKTDKFFFVAWNADFDADHIRSWFLKNGDEYFGSFFWYPFLDVCKIAGIRLMDQRRFMENFRLLTVTRQLNIPVDDAKAHDALYDIELTMKVFTRLMRDYPYLSAEATA